MNRIELDVGVKLDFFTGCESYESNEDRIAVKCVILGLFANMVSSSIAQVMPGLVQHQTYNKAPITYLKCIFPSQNLVSLFSISIFG